MTSPEIEAWSRFRMYAAVITGIFGSIVVVGVAFVTKGDVWLSLLQ